MYITTDFEFDSLLDARDLNAGFPLYRSDTKSKRHFDPRSEARLTRTKKISARSTLEFSTLATLHTNIHISPRQFAQSGLQEATVSLRSDSRIRRNFFDLALCQQEFCLHLSTGLAVQFLGIDIPDIGCAALMVIDGKFVDQKKHSRLFANDGELFSPINRVHYRRILADTRLRCGMQL